MSLALGSDGLHHLCAAGWDGAGHSEKVGANPFRIPSTSPPLPQNGWFGTHLSPPPPGHRFSPEVLGLCASTALVWVVMEVLALLLGIYLATVRSDLSTFHLLAYSGYKYVG